MPPSGNVTCQPINVTTEDPSNLGKDDLNALLYIVVTLLFYSMGIIIGIITYLKREQAEMEEDKMFDMYMQIKREPFNLYKRERVQQMALYLKQLEEQQAAREKIENWRALETSQLQAHFRRYQACRRHGYRHSSCPDCSKTSPIPEICQGFSDGTGVPFHDGSWGEGGGGTALLCSLTLGVCEPLLTPDSSKRVKFPDSPLTDGRAVPLYTGMDFSSWLRPYPSLPPPTGRSGSRHSSPAIYPNHPENTEAAPIFLTRPASADQNPTNEFKELFANPTMQITQEHALSHDASIRSPAQGISVTTPVQGISVTTPVQGISVTTPVQGISVTAPVQNPYVPSLSGFDKEDIEMRDMRLTHNDNLVDSAFQILENKARPDSVGFSSSNSTAKTPQSEVNAGFATETGIATELDSCLDNSHVAARVSNENLPIDVNNVTLSESYRDKLPEADSLIEFRRFSRHGQTPGPCVADVDNHDHSLPFNDFHLSDYSKTTHQSFAGPLHRTHNQQLAATSATYQQHPQKLLPKLPITEAPSTSAQFIPPQKLNPPSQLSLLTQQIQQGSLFRPQASNRPQASDRTQHIPHFDITEDNLSASFPGSVLLPSERRTVNSPLDKLKRTTSHSVDIGDVHSARKLGITWKNKTADKKHAPRSQPERRGALFFTQRSLQKDLDSPKPGPSRKHSRTSSAFYRQESVDSHHSRTSDLSENLESPLILPGSDPDTGLHMSSPASSLGSNPVYSSAVNRQTTHIPRMIRSQTVDSSKLIQK